MFYIPGEAIKTLKQVSYCIPVGLKAVRNYLPKENTPNSVTLILDTIPNLVPPPPEIPQPYLDADRKITVPDPKEVQYIIAIRNEYFTQYKSRIAAERVRLLREMSRFIAWTCLIPTITDLTIYEKKGTAWNGDHFSALDSIKNSILVELVAFASTCDQKDLKEFKNQIPKIILVHRYRKTRLVVNEEEIELSNTLASSQVPLNDEDADEVVDQVLDTYAERTMIVNLCDLRVRTSNFRELVHNGLHNPIESNDDIFNEEFPGTPDLVIAPSINGNASNKLLGYSCVDHNVEERKKAVVYFSHLDFGFQFFTRSLYHYALEKPLLHSGIEPSRNKVSGVIKQHPSKNIVHFFKKVTAIDLENKTNNQFVSTAI
ncbi:uncharacterized protein J8A68_001064 [[Candida] subhashii]|uniref:Uncharacterized protein n=1 Tax=[Candida] subhashii TaxID=561895 RepID=A0A8J5QIP4_9ASCO|nr:uncharacterized protein J8A68_001064 [[Candida] subhashii]KAG7665376.1 hypothetical protein J8A68_001064 [[Candida] subhashii]